MTRFVVDAGAVLHLAHAAIDALLQEGAFDLFHAAGMMPAPGTRVDLHARGRSPHEEEEAHVAGQTTDTPVLDLLAGMTALSLEASSLDEKGIMLARIAALVATDAPPISYALNLSAAGEVDVDPEQIRGVFAAIAPIVGTARIATAMGNIVRALSLEELAELEEQPTA